MIIKSDQHDIDLNYYIINRNKSIFYHYASDNISNMIGLRLIMSSVNQLRCEIL